MLDSVRKCDANVEKSHIELFKNARVSSLSGGNCAARGESPRTTAAAASLISAAVSGSRRGPSD